MLETLLQPNDKLERCGVLLKDGTVVEIRNVAPSPEDQFMMDPSTFLALVETGHVDATWHTHPQGKSNLSEDDRVGFLAWPSLDHIIVATDGMQRYTIEDGLVLQCD